MWRRWLKAMQNKTFYELNEDKARQLVLCQIVDGWTCEEIKEYFLNLGCGLFFVRRLVHPCFINPPEKHLQN